MAQLELRVADDDLDPVSRADLARDLLQSLRDADLDAQLGEQADAAPPDARSGGALETGLVLVQVAAESGVLNHLIDLVRGWLGRTETADVEIRVAGNRLRISAATPEERRRLVEHFIAVSAKTD